MWGLDSKGREEVGGGGGHVEGVIYIGVILCRGLSCGHLLRIFSLARDHCNDNDLNH